MILKALDQTAYCTCTPPDSFQSIVDLSKAKSHDSASPIPLISAVSQRVLDGAETHLEELIEEKEISMGLPSQM
jgi:hypothetical protein